MIFSRREIKMRQVKKKGKEKSKLNNLKKIGKLKNKILNKILRFLNYKECISKLKKN